MKKPEIANLDIKEIEGTCLECLKAETMIVRPEDFEAWMSGKHAQDAFPYLSADQRELLVSSTCGQCFDLMFPEVEE